MAKVKKYARGMDVIGAAREVVKSGNTALPSRYAYPGVGSWSDMGRYGGATGFRISPSIKGGMPGFKILKSFAKGGSASKRADGCATKGKTKGKMV